MASLKKITSISREPKEKDIERSILMYLEMVNIVAWKNQSTGIFDPTKKVFRKPLSKFSINGTADILGILKDGRFLAIEVKRPSTRNRTTDDQKKFINKINENGGLAFVATSIEDVREKLKLLS